MRNYIRKKLFLATLAVPIFAISNASGATVLFDFRTTLGAGVVDGNGNAPVSGGNFDPSTAGDTIALASTLGTGDDGLVLTATIIDILAPEFVDDGTGVFSRSGNTLSVLGGDSITTNIGGPDALGINNSSISNNQFDIFSNGNNGNEGNDFNDGESLIFSFDQDVIFTSIELESLVAGVDTFDVLIDGTSVLQTDIGDFIDLGDLDGLVITTGQQITFAASGTDAQTSFRIETFAVDVVPEPSSVALLSLGGLMLLRRRRR